LTTTQLEYQRSIEEGLKKKVQGMLEEVLGFSKAIARVSADIDFQQVESTEEKYDPTTILRSEQKTTERSTNSTGGMAGGEASSPDAKAAKAKTSAPSEGPAKPQPGPLPSINAQSSERQQEIRNYEISKINKRVRNSVGGIRKISTAVVVDGVYKETSDAKGKKERQYAPRSQEEMKSIESIVKKAIGYDEGRGDQVEVINMPFYWSGQEEEGGKPVKSNPWMEYLLMAYKPAVSLILALLFIFFVARPLMKKRVFSQEREVSLLQSAPAPMIAAPALQEARELGPMAIRDQTLKLIQEDPSKTVGIVKSWLHERE
jgi:flagellar M-ring protein FliF